MSAYQMAVRFQQATGLSLPRMYEGFLDWWVSLYAKEPRNLRPLI